MEQPVMKRFKNVSVEEGKVLFICHAVHKLKLGVKPYDPLDYEAVAALAAKELKNPSFNDVRMVKKFFGHYAKRNVYTWADFNYALQLEAGNFIKQEDAIVEQEYVARKLQRENEKREKTKEEEKREARNYLKVMLPYLDQDALSTEFMYHDLKRVGLRLSAEEVAECVRVLLMTEGSKLSSKLTVPFIGATEEEDRLYFRRMHIVSEAHRMRECMEYGVGDEWQNQRELYVMDLRLLGKFVTFQTLASQECYMYMGERFKFRVRELEVQTTRNMEKELYEHVRVVTEMLEGSDYIDNERYRYWEEKDYNNFTTRNKEMRVLRRRFGCVFGRFSCYSVLNDTSGDFEDKQNLVTIFYRLWHNAYRGEKGVTKSVKSLIGTLIQKGLVSKKRTPSGWKYCLMEKLSDLRVPQQEIDIVLSYYPSLSNPVGFCVY